MINAVIIPMVFSILIPYHIAMFRYREVQGNMINAVIIVMVLSILIPYHIAMSKHREV